MARAYKRMIRGTYWNIRVPEKLKARAKRMASRLKTTPSEIARNGIEKELNFLERENDRWSTSEKK